MPSPARMSHCPSVVHVCSMPGNAFAVATSTARMSELRIRRGDSRLTTLISSSGISIGSAEETKPPTDCGRTTSGDTLTTCPMMSERWPGVSGRRRRTTMRSPAVTSSERKMPI